MDDRPDPATGMVLPPEEAVDPDTSAAEDAHVRILEGVPHGAPDGVGGLATIIWHSQIDGGRPHSCTQQGSTSAGVRAYVRACVSVKRTAVDIYASLLAVGWHGTTPHAPPAHSSDADKARWCEEWVTQLLDMADPQELTSLLNHFDVPAAPLCTRPAPGECRVEIYSTILYPGSRTT